MKHYSFLLIDDEAGVLKALSLLLGVYGHTTHSFSSSLEAVEFLKANDPEKKIDLILCDLRMPAPDGLEVLRIRNEIASDLPFILMSGHATDAEKKQASSEGATSFLSKPFDPEDLAEKLQEIFGNNETTTASN